MYAQMHRAKHVCFCTLFAEALITSSSLSIFFFTHLYFPFSTVILVVLCFDILPPLVGICAFFFEHFGDGAKHTLFWWHNVVGWQGAWHEPFRYWLALMAAYSGIFWDGWLVEMMMCVYERAMVGGWGKKSWVFGALLLLWSSMIRFLRTNYDRFGFAGLRDVFLMCNAFPFGRWRPRTWTR
jgi:hypothetical protein